MRGVIQSARAKWCAVKIAKYYFANIADVASPFITSAEQTRLRRSGALIPVRKADRESVGAAGQKARIGGACRWCGGRSCEIDITRTYTSAHTMQHCETTADVENGN